MSPSNHSEKNKIELNQEFGRVKRGPIQRTFQAEMMSERKTNLAPN
jgi:hypothetical protein